LNSKVIFLDWGIFMYRSIFCWERTRAVPPTYTAMSMVIACLKLIDLTPEDVIIIAVDSYKGSWRREVDSNYKANRKADRAKHLDIDWDTQFRKFNELLENISSSTPFHVIVIDKLEADDIIAYGVRYFKDSECVIISTDSDYEQLVVFNNVKLFSPVSKKYKIVKDPHKILARKIVKETSDNLVTPITTQEQYEKRKKIVSLIQLPEEVEYKIKQALKKLDFKKDFKLENLRSKSIKNRFMQIYNNDNIVTISDSFGKKRKRRKKQSIAQLEL